MGARRVRVDLLELFWLPVRVMQVGVGALRVGLGVRVDLVIVDVLG